MQSLAIIVKNKKKFFVQKLLLKIEKNLQLCFEL